MWDLDFVLMFAKERSKRVKMTQREENYFSETGGKSRLCQACAGTHFKPRVLSFNPFSASMHVALATESDFCSLSLIQTLGWLGDLWTRLQVCPFCVSATRKACEPHSVLLTGRSAEQQVKHERPPQGLLTYVISCASSTLHF